MHSVGAAPDLSVLPQSFAEPPGTLPSDRLRSLVHNAPNTGIMLPDRFDPWQDTYVLTVAHWVSRITFTPIAADPSAVITVNGSRWPAGRNPRSST